MGVSQNIRAIWPKMAELCPFRLEVLTRKLLRLRARYRKQRITPPLAEKEFLQATTAPNATQSSSEVR